MRQRTIPRPPVLPIGPTPMTGRDWAARLPFDVAFGPWQLAVQWRAPAQMLDPRQAACLNLEAGRIELRQDLTGLALAEAFLDALVQLGQRRRGAVPRLGESAQALATAWVEFAWRNPRTWLWLNLLLGQHLPGRPRFDRAVRGTLVRAPALPYDVRVGGQVLRLQFAAPRSGPATPGRAGEAGAREVRLPAGRAGSALPVVALREITQAIQQAAGLAPHHAPCRFRRAQAQGWLALMCDRPDVWRWLVWTMSRPRAAGRRDGPTAADALTIERT